MKNSIIYLLLVVALIISKPGVAQQSSLFNTYSMDPLQLNIAYAGAACTEANLHYRTQWIGMKESPKLLQLNAHAALGESNGLGLRVNSQSQGFLNTLQATLGYAYRFRIGKTAKMHLGVGIGWTQAALNAQKAVVIDANDVTLSNNSRQTANGFDSEFGAMVIGEKLKAGISVLHLYNTNPDFSGSSTYRTLPQFNTQVSYVLNKGKKVEVEPMLLDRYTYKGNNIIEGMLNFNFIKAITVGAGYRSNYGVIALLGAKVGNVKLAYSFDYGTTKNSTNMGSSHQVMLGFNLCKTTKAPKPVEVPQPLEAKEPELITPAATPTVEPVKEETAVKEEVKKEEPKQEEVRPASTPAKTKAQILDELNRLAEKMVFTFGKAQLHGEALAKLDDIADLLKKNPDVAVNIVGYTCDKGPADANNLLSVQRSGYVRNQLIKRGVQSENIKESKGVGAERPLYDNNTELRSKNRTVRFELSE